MTYRTLGRTGWQVSTISFGAWAIGGTWGTVDDNDSLAAMHRAIDLGVNFIDTSDVYGDGRSERLIRQLRSERSETIYVATKAGRRLNPHVAAGYTAQNLNAFVDRSRENLGMETLDLLQVHCPPTPTFYQPETFDALEEMVAAGKIRHWGASVEKVEEGLKAMEYPGCQSIQIVFNLFRQRPAGLFLSEAKRRQVGVLARLPLSSGMLTGKLRAHSNFESDDHRNFNRDGAAFDKGETFSGVPYEVGLEAVEALRPLVPPGMSMGQLALRWILDHEAVTCAIPGGKNPEQVEANCAAADLPPLSSDLHKRIEDIYTSTIKAHVHDRW
ncbi:MAG: aldo/keto reductase [Fimbriimonas sp.]